MKTIRMAVGMLLCGAVVAVVVYAISATRKPKFAASLSITVDRASAQTTVEYQYDGYYAIQAADLFSQTLLSWFLTPSTLLSFYDEAGLDSHITSLNEIVSRFRARKFSAQNLVVQFADADRNTAERLGNAINTVVERNGEQLNVTASGDPLFDIRTQTPVIVETRTNAPLNALLAFVVSIFLGLVVMTALRSLRAEQHADRR